ncbi:hypothetical protein ACS0TY_013244 [Phlomoides rotata]
MSDLYGSNESEDMSSFLQILLQNSSSSAATTDSTAASAAAGGLFSGRGAVAESSSSINFSDPSCFFTRESDEMNPSCRGKNLASSCEGAEAYDVQVNPPLPRSSKRTRAAEVHNLSEKRRRSRINEKLKALQNLVPNSNKTDKASMLDEAIEYLKQLQLQVQVFVSILLNHMHACWISTQNAQSMIKFACVLPVVVKVQFFSSSVSGVIVHVCESKSTAKVVRSFNECYEVLSTSYGERRDHMWKIKIVLMHILHRIDL